MYVHGFRFFFTPLAGVLFAFPHGTGSLSVSQEYLALEDGPPIFRQDTTCPALLIELTVCAFLCTGLSPCIARLPDASTNTHTDSGSGLLPVRSPLLGESRFISFPRGTLDVSVPPVGLINLSIQLMIVCRNTLGFPIRKSPVITVHITLPTLIAD